MATVSYKAVAVAQNLLMNLQFQFPVASGTGVQTAGQLVALWTLGTQSNGYPYLAAVTGTTTDCQAVVAVQSLLSVDTIWTDSLGNSAYPFTPTILQVAFEAGASTLATVGYINQGAALKLYGTLAQTGAQIQLFHSANGSASLTDLLAVLGVVPTVGGAGAPDVTFDNYQYPGVASM